MPPPHRPASTGLSAIPAHRRARIILLCASLTALAGCATQPSQSARADSIDELVSGNRSFLIARSDPLGAWLDSNPPLSIDRPAGQPADLSQAPHTMAGTALKFLGVKYRSGGNGPNQGFDCSGLVAYAAEKSLGLKLPRMASEQATQGVAVQRNELRRGDLVFFNTLGRRFSHVGIYLGNQKFVHAPRTGASIRVESMDIAYWRKRYNGARRLQAPAPTTATARR